MERFLVKVTDKQTGFCYLDFPILAVSKSYELITHTKEMLEMCLWTHFEEKCIRYGKHTPDTPEVNAMCERIQKECYGKYITPKFIDDNFDFKIVRVKKKSVGDIEFLKGEYDD